jgi:glycosyltransferase 2 family protein
LNVDPVAGPPAATSAAPSPGDPAAEAATAGRGFEKLGRRLLASAALGVLACVALALASDAHKLAGRLHDFDPLVLVPILALSLGNYALRFVRWHLYLRSLGIELAWPRSLAVFLVGFLLSVTPGKAGELGKAWMVRELGGGSVLRAVPAVLAERLTDALGVFAVMGLAALPLPHGGLVCAAGLGLAVGGGLVLTWQRGADLLFRGLIRIPFLGRRAAHLAEILASLRTVLTPRLIAFGAVVAALAWGAEGVGFVLAARQYAPGAGMLAGIFDYNLGTTLGAMTMLPGGLLAAEGALTALLKKQGLETAAAASATIVVRAATLWFAALLGLIALPFVARWIAARKRSAG